MGERYKRGGWRRERTIGNLLKKLLEREALSNRPDFFCFLFLLLLLSIVVTYYNWVVPIVRAEFNQLSKVLSIWYQSDDPWG